MSDVKRYTFQIHRRPYGLEEVSSGNLVMHSDYAALEAETQALRDEVAALSARVVVVVVPDAKDELFCYSDWDAGKERGWNDCRDEVERLNGKAVSEGLLRQLFEDWQNSCEHDLEVAMMKLAALLDGEPT